MLLGAFSVCFGDGRRKGEGLSAECGLAAECGLSGQVWRVGQRNCRWYVVCRGKFGEWVKRPVSGVWFVGAKRASGSRGLSLVCGLSWRKGRVGQEACRWRVVCRGKFGEWVKRIVASVWSVGAKTLRGSRELSLACGLSWRKGRVGQRNHTYRMPQTSQIATQIKIAKTLKT